MNGEIDYSGQGMWKLTTIFVYVLMVFSFLFVALGIPPEYSFIENEILLLVLVMEPFVAVLIGSLLGFLTKRSVRISTDRLVFNEETKRLSEFGSVYFEGSDTSLELGGYLPSGITWIIFLVTVPTTLDILLIFTTPFLAGMVSTISCGFLYFFGYHLIKSASPIRTHMVNNPIYKSLTKYITVQDALDTFKECQYADHLIVKYRHAKGEVLNLIDDVHVFIVTKSDPALEIEITLQNIQNIGLELSIALDSRSISQKKDNISVDRSDALLTVNDTGMNTVISVTYLMNRFSARLALGNATKNCKLLEALLFELADLVPELKLFDKDVSSG
ncbi:MAG: hypothetical protein ACTSUO_06710 [Candidatus Thorarchaeota archaeon]